MAVIEPYCEGVDLCAPVVDWARLNRMNQAKRASRSVLLRDMVNRLGGRMEKDKYRQIERPDSPCGMSSERPPNYAAREQRVHSRLLLFTKG
ncbi:MAG: hypothetical protein OXE42_05875 [Gammaproteobacteria bacterium]|nr:hypothetical protein [Gammaproteobacteria bacterium]